MDLPDGRTRFVRFQGLDGLPKDAELVPADGSDRGRQILDHTIWTTDGDSFMAKPSLTFRAKATSDGRSWARGVRR